MKKSLLALAVLGSFAAVAHAQTSVTIYGIIDTGVAYQSKASANNGSQTGMTSGLFSGSRLGFKGSEDLGGGLKANFQLEAGFNGDTGALNGQDTSSSNNLFRRTSTVGLSGGFGAVNVGRQTDFAYSGPAGGMQTFSSAGYVGASTTGNGTGVTRLQGSRTNNSIRYDMPSFNGLNGGVMYGLGEQAGNGTAGQSYAAGLRYDNGPIGLGASFYKSKFGTAPSDSTLYPAIATASTLDNGTKTFTLGASYDFGFGKLYGNWSRATTATFGATGAASHIFNLGGTTASSNNKTNLFEVGYNHNLTASLKLLTGLSYTRANFTDSTTGNMKEAFLATDYFLSKRTDLYAIAMYSKASSVGNPLSFSAATTATNQANNVFGLGVGIRHAF
ncbi:MAG: porin [Herbaspirillum sp.]|jgi:predicted porin|nr:porin [Herbaspirillum sp.]